MIQLIDIIKNRKPIEIIEVLLENKDLYQKEIEERTKFSRNTVVKWLDFLVRNNFLEFKIRGKEKYYKVNKDNPILKKIKTIITLSKILPLVKDLEGENYIFGSAAKGEDDEKSDIDILIIGNPEKKELNEFVDKAIKLTKKPVKPIIMNPLDYSRLMRKDPVFYENIENSKIKLK